MGDGYDQRTRWERINTLNPVKQGSKYSRKLTEIDDTVATKFKTAIKDMKQGTDTGDNKHGKNSWQDEDNPSLQHMTNCHSMFHHLADLMMCVTEDKYSRIAPLLHLACRSFMAYERNYSIFKEEEKQHEYTYSTVHSISVNYSSCIWINGIMMYSIVYDLIHMKILERF